MITALPETKPAAIHLSPNLERAICGAVLNHPGRKKYPTWKWLMQYHEVCPTCLAQCPPKYGTHLMTF